MSGREAGRVMASVLKPEDKRWVGVVGLVENTATGAYDDDANDDGSLPGLVPLNDGGDSNDPLNPTAL